MLQCFNSIIIQKRLGESITKKIYLQIEKCVVRFNRNFPALIFNFSDLTIEESAQLLGKKTGASFYKMSVELNF